MGKLGMFMKKQTLKMALVVVILLTAAPGFSFPLLKLNIINGEEGLNATYNIYDGNALNYTISDNGNYEFLLIDKSYKIIVNDKFSFNRAADANINLSFFSTEIPFNENMKYLQIKHDNISMHLIDLNICNSNDICDENENTLTCANDCSADMEDNLCINNKDNICDPDCLEGYDTDCNPSKEAIYLLIAGILVIGFIFFHDKIIKKR